VNLRPARLYPGVRSPLASPPEIDLVVVREGTEGPYAGTGGHLRKDTTHEIATEVSINTAFGVERVVRDAFARAANRPRKHLTLVHKTNVMAYAGGLWSRIVEEVSLEYPDVGVAYQHVDATTIHLVTDPGRFDVIVTDNLFGDILTDLAAAVTGGIGLAASGNLDVSRRNPSMFEPVHGSAPDIAGQGIADPTAAVLSVALLLDHLGRSRRPARWRPRWRSTWPPATTAPPATPSPSATAWPPWSAAPPLRRHLTPAQTKRSRGHPPRRRVAPALSQVGWLSWVTRSGSRRRPAGRRRRRSWAGPSCWPRAPTAVLPHNWVNGHCSRVLLSLAWHDTV